MSDYPKTYEKGGRTKVVHNTREEVAAQFDGYRPEALDGSIHVDFEPAAQSDPAPDAVQSDETKDDDTEPVEDHLDGDGAPPAPERPKPQAPKRRN